MSLLTLVACSASASWEPVGKKELEADARLRVPVVLQKGRLYVAEVAQALSKQTAVTVEADDRTGAGDAQVLVWIKDQPAWKVMSALGSLFSYKQALWTWERDGLEGRWSYRLVQTHAAQALPARLAEVAQRDFEEDTLRRIVASRRTEQQWVERLADPTPVRIDERAGWGLQLFAACLTPEDQKAVLRGEKQATVLVEDLPPFGRRLVEDLYKEMQPHRRLPNGERVPSPLPTRLTMYSIARGPDPTASLYLDLEDMGGYAYAGGLPLERRYRNFIQSLGLNGDDAPSSKEWEDQVIPRKKVSEATEALSQLEGHIMRLAEMTDLPVLARSYHFDGTASVRQLAGMTVREVLDRLVENYRATWKWHESILLISYAAWYRHPAEVNRVPWAVVKRLREACASNGGLVTLEALLDVSRSVTPDQLEVLQHSPWPNADQLRSVLVPFTLIAQAPEMRRKFARDGVLIVRGPTALVMAGGIRQSSVSAEELGALEFHAKEQEEGGVRRLYLEIRFLNKRGNRLFYIPLCFEPGAP